MALWSNTDAAPSKPKYLTTAEKTATAGVSVEEAGVTANKAKVGCLRGSSCRSDCRSDGCLGPCRSVIGKIRRR